MPKPRGRKPKRPGRRPALKLITSQEPAESPAPQLVDAAVADLVATLEGAPDEVAPLVAEAAIANLVCMVDDTMGGPDGGGPTEMQGQFWSDVAADLATREDEASRIVLTGLTRLVDGAYRLPLERALRRHLEIHVGPGWIGRLATARLRRAILVEDLAGDGCGVTLGYDDGAEGHSLLVYIDNNLGGLAKDIGVGPPIDDVLARSARAEGVVARDVTPGVALGVVLAGLGQTMHTLDAPTSDDYEQLHSMLVLRIGRERARVEVPPAPIVVDDGGRDTLVREFMRSGYPDNLSTEPDEVADIARTWLDHALDYTIGAPLRVSAVLVELFLADWLPRKVVADRAYFAAVPGVVEAWLRFAAARTHLPGELLSNALSAVERYAPVMRRRAEDPAAWGIGKSLLGGHVDDDPLEASWMSLPGLGVAPYPDGTGLAPHTVTQLDSIARRAWVLAGETLGTDHAGPAFAIAERIAREAPEILDEARLTTWPAAITWLLAEDEDLLGRGKALGVAQLSGELGVSVQTLRARSRRIREALG